jgi:hypothetical protein
MPKFRKRPVVIEAVQLTRENIDVIAALDGVKAFSYEENYRPTVQAQIDTLEGVMTASEGDWIITGVNGEKYPCKPDIFEKTYEPVE